MNDFSLIHPTGAVELVETKLPERPCWIEPMILTKRGKLLFGGHAKIGKSALGLELCRSLVLGTHPFGCPIMTVPSPARVLLIEQELGPWILQDRLTKILREDMENPLTMGPLRENFKQLSQVRGLKLDTIEAVDAITGWCQETQANVLMLDPIGKMHGYDENDNSQISRLFDRIERILDNCKSQDLSIIISHHFGKPSRDPRMNVDEFDPYNFRGASKWYDDPDTLVTVVRVPNQVAGKDGWFVRTKWECRGGAPPFEEPATISITKNGDFRAIYEKGKFSTLLIGPTGRGRRIDTSVGAVRV